MFWKSSVSSSLLEGEHDNAEASYAATKGRPRRSGALVRSRLMLSPSVSKSMASVATRSQPCKSLWSFSVPLVSQMQAICRSTLSMCRYSRPLSKQMEEGGSSTLDGDVGQANGHRPGDLDSIFDKMGSSRVSCAQNSNTIALLLVPSSLKLQPGSNCVRPFQGPCACQWSGNCTSGLTDWQCLSR